MKYCPNAKICEHKLYAPLSTQHLTYTLLKLSSLWLPMAPYGSQWLVNAKNGSLWLPKAPYTPYGSLFLPMAPLCFLSFVCMNDLNIYIWSSTIVNWARIPFCFLVPLVRPFILQSGLYRLPSFGSPLIYCIVSSIKHSSFLSNG